ncbi:MAG: hypothetical protein QM645_07295 [Asticcacaulis sp.]
MSQRILFEPDRRKFGVIIFPNMGTKVSTLNRALETALGAKVTHQRKGWFGPKQNILHFHQQTVALEVTPSGDAVLDVSAMDDEPREELLEILHQAEDFDRI